MKKFKIFIPARYHSSRFPGKPLAKILAKEMINYVYSTCIRTFPYVDVYVLTDSQKIKNFCKKKFINCMMTSKKCKTGTDRILEIYKKIKTDIYFNVQGDEPLIEKENLKKFVRYALKNSSNICIAKSQISKKGYLNINIPKIVTNENENLMYISRSSIPAQKEKNTLNKKYYGQVNLYSFPNKFLSFELYNKKTALEKIEDIEILRFLEHGQNIKVLKLNSNNHPVDIPKDIKIVEQILKKNVKKIW